MFSGVVIRFVEEWDVFRIGFRRVVVIFGGEMWYLGRLDLFLMISTIFLWFLEMLKGVLGVEDK